MWASKTLSHPNVVPLLGVYSAPGYPFALVYEMMENMDLGQYITQHPNISRVKLVSMAFTILSAAIPWLNHFTADRDLTCIELHAQPRYHPWKHKVGMSSYFLWYRSMFTPFQRNVLVDSNDVARLGGLGSAFGLSLPVSWSDVESEKLFCGIAPELIDPRAFGFVHARTTKATDMFAFGMLAWEVRFISFYSPVSRNSFAYVSLSSSPVSLRSPEWSKPQYSSLCFATSDHRGLIILK